MARVRTTAGSLVVTAYRGDAKTLLAFDLTDPAARVGLAGFTIEVTPPGGPSYFLRNMLRFEKPGDHAQDANEPATSTLNAPLHTFRWVHHPGLFHQGLEPALGIYTYTVTPRTFDAHGSLTPLDPGRSATVAIEVDRFRTGKVSVGFTRGYVQSQAFVGRFGVDALIEPKVHDLVWDRSQVAGVNARGERSTFDQEHQWLGFTAREQIYALLDEVQADPGLSVDVFAYDLDEAGIVERLLALGSAKRARIILDKATLHHTKDDAKPEDQFTIAFDAASKGGRLKRGKFLRFAHDKVFVVSDAAGPLRVLTGSTNFATSGLYVNSNHVLLFDDRKVAAAYAGVFQEAWDDDVSGTAFKKTTFSTTPSTFDTKAVPGTTITFAPHDEETARDVLGRIVDRVEAEGVVPDGRGSVLFAVMALDGAADNPVYDTLKALHRREVGFSYGISDIADGIALYKPGRKTGVLVTGRPTRSVLPPPFNQVPSIGSRHQVHHKFVVCGFNGDDPVVWCGSSNLAMGGEQQNGDNLLEIHDESIATVFAIEALELVDHFHFLDSHASKPGTKQVPVNKEHAAATKGAFLSTTDGWAAKFFDPNDLHAVDRELFGG